MQIAVILLAARGVGWLLRRFHLSIAIAGKFGGVSAAARISGLRWREACALGALMNARGMMELVILDIGLEAGIISPSLFTMMVIMALVTTVITTPLLEWIHPSPAPVLTSPDA